PPPARSCEAWKYRGSPYRAAIDPPHPAVHARRERCGSPGSDLPGAAARPLRTGGGHRLTAVGLVRPWDEGPPNGGAVSTAEPYGTQIRSSVPFDGPVTIENSPPSNWTRSSMPRNPIPSWGSTSAR